MDARDVILSEGQSAEMVAAWEETVSSLGFEEVTDTLFLYPAPDGLEPGDRMWDASISR